MEGRTCGDREDGKKEGKREGEREKRGKEGGNKVGRQEGRWEEERLGERQIEYSQFSLFSCLEPFLPTRVLILVPYSSL